MRRYGAFLPRIRGRRALRPLLFPRRSNCRFQTRSNLARLSTRRSNEIDVPDGVKIAVAPSDESPDLVSAMVAVIRGMQRLMSVTNKMNREP
jgi:hypothetical protein